MSFFQMIGIGASYGGIKANKFLIPALSRLVSIPIILVQHAQSSHENILVEQLDEASCAEVKEAKHGMSIKNNSIFVAPGGYHLLVENSSSLALSVDDPVCFSRPSIDVLFESMSDIYADKLILILLTGANDDGAAGLSYAHKQGALTIAQDPNTAKMPIMPQAGIDTGEVDYILSLEAIPPFIKQQFTSEALSRE